MRQPLLGHEYGGSSHSPCGYNCTPLQSVFLNLKSFRMEPLVVLTSTPIVVMMVTLDYEMSIMLITLIMLSITICQELIIAN